MMKLAHYAAPQNRARSIGEIRKTGLVSVDQYGFVEALTTSVADGIVKFMA